MLDKDFWWCIELETDLSGPEAEEALWSAADLSGSIGSELIDANADSSERKITILRAAYISSQDISYWLEIVNDVLTNFPNLRVRSYSKIENQPWQTQHLDAFPPLLVGVNLVVAAPWHKDKIPPDKMPLYIYPSSAFGTGYHESTQIALSMIERFLKPGNTIVDVGTGSGVLFIAALKLGAANAVARDIDPTVIAEVLRNMELNELPLSACDARVGDLLNGVEAQADVLAANILLGPNLKLLPDVGRVLKTSGVAIFTGMTVSERPTFLAAIAETSLSVTAELTIKDWWGLACQVE